MAVIRTIRTNTPAAYGYVQDAPLGYRWTFRYAPAFGEFHIFESGKASTVKEAIDEIYSSARQYDFTIQKENV